MNDHPLVTPMPPVPPENLRSPGEISVEEWVQAALDLGQKGLREDVAVPNPKGGYIVVTRSLVGGQS